MYSSMATARRMEMSADGLYNAKLIRGFRHLSTGQVTVFFFFFFLPNYDIDHHGVQWTPNDTH